MAENEFDPDPDSLARASRVTNAVVGNALEDREIDEGTGIDFPAGDVFDAMERLGNLFRFSRHTRQPLPCIAIGSDIVAIDAPAWPFDYWPRPGRLPWQFRELAEEEVQMEPLERVVASTKSTLASFLALRIAAFFQPPGAGRGNPGRLSRGAGPTSATGGGGPAFAVNVQTVGAGIQVSSSPAFFVTWAFFGGPTSPVVPPPAPNVNGGLLGGTYIFGGRAPQRHFVRDRALFRIPATRVCQVTAF